jgi:two-component SAPR family response regulator
LASTKAQLRTRLHLFPTRQPTTSKKLDAKAYLRAAQAFYVLKRYNAAAEYCQNLLSLHEDHNDTKKILAQVAARSREQSSDIYDIAAIRTFSATP